MDYISFDKNQLINLEYSLTKELIRSSSGGSYACSTIIGCNTRKYHGLLVSPQPKIDDGLHVLLSSLDVTVIQHEAEFNLGIHKYQGDNYYPKGYKYIRDFVIGKIPKLVYRVGGVILAVERLFSRESDRMMIKYTLEEGNSATTLKFTPFLAFRNRHQLSKANTYVNKKYKDIENGIKIKMYDGYTPIYMQFSKKVEYTHVPDWYYNIEYIEEQQRGYDYKEDLFVPGFFELPIKKGESIIFAAGLNEETPKTLSQTFKQVEENRVSRDSFKNCLINSADQFINHSKNGVEIVAGYPWFGRWGRDSFIALPGLTIEIGKTELCKKAIKTLIKDLKGPLFPNIGSGNNSAYNSVDAPLWFFWTLQKYAEATGSKAQIWKEYGEKMQLILNGYREGTEFNIKMQDNGLIYAGIDGKALTWMDAISNSTAVTPRIGMPVEINALWYNAVMFSIETALLADDIEFVKNWEPIAKIIPDSFTKTFWRKEKGYLADYVNGDIEDWSVRPNQIFATSLEYSPIDEEKRHKVIDKVEKELLTTRGIRTLSPKNPKYEGVYFGNQETRDKQYHQGTVWPWLFGHFVEGYLKIHGKSGWNKMNWYYEQFNDVMKEHGIGSISEVYDGDPPHKAGGCISQAWSVAELLRVGNMLKKYKK
ncbi:MAG: amylo-alpha-1,6-glucosidase [Saprospiraceae bacterium]|nr:amylo-alpha-1,6-glucosidase [Saprospiraceae bacterium]